VLDGGSCCTDSSSDIVSGDVMGPAPSIEVAVQGAVCLHVVVAKVKDRAVGSLDGAESVWSPEWPWPRALPPRIAFFWLV
jgi:hypothetical protein